MSVADKVAVAFAAKGGHGCADGAGAGDGKGAAPLIAPLTETGSVVYENPVHCQFAIAMLNGSNLNGGTLEVDWDYNGAPDGSKIWVGGIPVGTGWRDLEKHFSAIGPVAEVW